MLDPISKGVDQQLEVSGQVAGYGVPRQRRVGELAGTAPFDVSVGQHFFNGALGACPLFLAIRAQEVKDGIAEPGIPPLDACLGVIHCGLLVERLGETRLGARRHLRAGSRRGTLAVPGWSGLPADQ
ncbi:MAG: hypothetical protein U0797_00950 [Gemmataceae bacterium]